jgi:hypothetical protein
MNTSTLPPEVQAKLDCLSRARMNLRDTVVDLEAVFGSEDALMIAAGAMRSLTQVDRLAQRIAREAAE